VFIEPGGAGGGTTIAKENPHNNISKSKAGKTFMVFTGMLVLYKFYISYAGKKEKTAYRPAEINRKTNGASN
jgi:hypothetical protein